jgi:NAD(P)-dependent dehydrogenase (short-subunit alcohol dehydrogenase family)
LALIVEFGRELRDRGTMSTFARPSNGAALVTGGAHRIGRTIVLALARAGYAVAVHARRSRNEAETLCDEIARGGGVARMLLADLADHDAATRLVPQACEAVGRLTLLVNNANEFAYDEVGKLERDSFDRQIAVGLRAPIFLAQAFAAQASDDGMASIINLLDQRVYRQMPRFFSYGLAKSALYVATGMLAQALAPKVRVNGVAPGPTLPSPMQSKEDFARQCSALPLQRGPNPDGIAEAVLYLARAGGVTGETIAVDGGQHLSWLTPDEAEITG